MLMVEVCFFKAASFNGLDFSGNTILPLTAKDTISRETTIGLHRQIVFVHKCQVNFGGKLTQKERIVRGGNENEFVRASQI